MVYQIYINGENVDAEFGQHLDFAEFFHGEYGKVLQEVEKYLRLIDFGSVSVVNRNKVVYTAVKSFGDVERLELN